MQACANLARMCAVSSIALNGVEAATEDGVERNVAYFTFILFRCRMRGGLRMVFLEAAGRKKNRAESCDSARREEVNLARRSFSSCVCRRFRWPGGRCRCLQTSRLEHYRL